jgi:hypothetical protein
VKGCLLVCEDVRICDLCRVNGCDVFLSDTQRVHAQNAGKKGEEEENGVMVVGEERRVGFDFGQEQAGSSKGQ